LSSSEMRRGFVRLGSSHVAVNYPQTLEPWFHGLVEAGDETAGLRRWVGLHAREDCGGFDVLASATPPAAALDLGDALATFWERVSFFLLDELRDAIAFHAAALCHDNGFVLLPGQTGAGKTRLSLWYRAQGFDLGTDEIVIVSVRPNETSEVILGGALRRPVFLKALGDANMLLRPAETPVAQQSSSWGLLLRLAGASWTQTAVNRGLIVFPRFVAGAPFKLSALTPGEAALGLIENCLNARNLPRGGLPFASLLARRLPAVALDYGETSQLDGTLDVFTRRVLAGPVTVEDLTALCATHTGAENRKAGCERTEAEDSSGQERKHQDGQQAPDILISRWWGRFGNKVHQYAFAATYAAKHNSRVIMPEWWEGVDIFAIPEHYLADKILRNDINVLRRQKHESCVIAYMEGYYEKNNIAEKERYKKLDINDACYSLLSYSDQSRSKVVFEDLCAYHAAVFNGMHIDQLRAIFAFNTKVTELPTYKYWQKRRGTYDAAHVRRTDSVNTDWFVTVSKESYVNAMQDEGIDEDRVIWVSDDPSLRRNCPPLLPTVSETFDIRQHGFSWLEDFLILYFARRIFRANSSFSWWAAALSPTATVFSPVVAKFKAGLSGEQLVTFVRGNRPHWYLTDVEMSVAGME
jgi:hypothetical protein